MKYYLILLQNGWVLDILDCGSKELLDSQYRFFQDAPYAIRKSGYTDVQMLITLDYSKD